MKTTPAILFLTAISMLMTPAARSAGIVEDVEPNDTLATATSTGIVGEGSALVIGGSLGNGPTGAADRDLYSFLIEDSYDVPPFLVTVTMNPPNAEFDAYLRLFDDQGRELESADDDESGLTPTLRTFIVRARNPVNHEIAYYVGASHALNQGYDPTATGSGRNAPTGAYVLSIEIAPFPTPPSSIEDPINETPVVVASLPAEYDDQFIGDGEYTRQDYDEYVIPVAGPSIVTAEVRLGYLHTLEPVLKHLYGDVRQDLRHWRAEFAVFEASSVSIIVSGTHGAPFAPIGRSLGFYDIVLNAVPMTGGAIDGPLEPNDSLAEATQTGSSWPGSVDFDGFIGDGKFGGTRGDIDCFEVSLAASQQLVVKVVPTGGGNPIDPVVRLYDYWGADMGMWSANASGAVRATFTTLPGTTPDPIIVVVMGSRDRPTMDPFVPPNIDNHYVGPDDHRQATESIDGGPGSTGAYRIIFTVTDEVAAATPIETAGLSGLDAWLAAIQEPPQTAPADAPVSPAGADSLRTVFATNVGPNGRTVSELDADTGETLREIPLPEFPTGLADGLAYDGTNLFWLGAGGRFPNLYRLDAVTGDVIERVNSWFGSGIYGDMATLGDTLYVVDLLDDHIYAVPASLTGPARRLEMGGLGGISFFGALVAREHPDRLWATYADDPSGLLEMDANEGIPTGFLALQTACACDGDLDRDGDVDDVDVAAFDQCHGAPAFAECARADLDCNRYISTADRNILLCQRNGPAMPPHDGCCPNNLPIVKSRAASLAAVYPHALAAGDWSQTEIQRFALTGQFLGSVDVPSPVGAMASRPLTLLADADGDADVDLIDWGAFQACFRGGDAASPSAYCAVFDSDLDQDVDVDDYVAFHQSVTGVGP